MFCIGDGASEQMAQTLANLLQVKVLAFTDARIEFRVEVLEGADDRQQSCALETDSRSRLASAPTPFVFNNFEQMVTEDAAKTGRLVSPAQTFVNLRIRRRRNSWR